MRRWPKNVYEDRWVPSACNMCYNACSLKGHVVNNTLIKIEGNPDSDIGWGRMCPKGVSGIMTFYDPSRLNVPLLRTNPEKGRGVDPGWKEISWDEALDIMCTKLKEVYERNPQELFLQGTTTANTVFENVFLNFALAFGTSNISAAGAGLHCGNAAHTMNGIFHGSWSIVPDFQYCNYAIYFGCSKGHSAGHGTNVNAQQAAEARERGMRMVVVDPVNNFAAAKSDEWIPIVPGTDAAMALAMVNHIINGLGIYDGEYLKKYTNGPYLIGPDGMYYRDPETHKPLVWDPVSEQALPFDHPEIKDFALEGTYTVHGQSVQPAFALLREHVKQYTPELAETITGVSAKTIRHLAHDFSKAARIGSTITIDGHTLPYRPAAAIYFRGAQGHKNGIYSCAAIELLNQVTGVADRVGGALGFNPACDGHPGSKFPAYAPTADEDGHLIAGTWVVPHKPFPIRRPSEPIESMNLSQILPMTVMSAFYFSKDQQEVWERVGLPYRPQLMLNFGANSIMSVGNSDTVAETLKRIPYIISFDIFLNEFSDYADLILPDASYLERYDVGPNHPFIFGHPSGMGRWSWPIRQPMLKEPIGQRRDMQEVMLEVANRIGIRGQLNMHLNVFWEMKGKYWLDPDVEYSWEEMCDRRLKSSFGEEHGLEWFKEHGVISWPKKVEEVYWREFLTPRVPIYMEFLPRLRLDAEPIAEKYGLPIDFDAYYGPLPKYIPNHPDPSKIQDYDMLGFYYRHTLHTNSFTMQNPWLNEVSEQTPGVYEVIINVETGRAKGFKDYDLIVLENPAGVKVQARVLLRETVHPGCVAIAANCGHWADGMPVAKGKGVFFNDLIEIDFDHIDPVSQNLELSVPLKVYKAAPTKPAKRGWFGGNRTNRELTGISGD